VLGDGSDKERQKALIEMADKSTISNCIIGTAPGTQGSADGIHCKGTCTLNNVWFEDVGEDAVTFYGIEKKAHIQKPN
jgi:tetrahydromethanopterin S-methyltransferase subunit H